MNRMMAISVEDGNTKLLFEFYNCGEPSRETGCPSLPNLMKPLIVQVPYSKDQILVQWHAHRPAKSVLSTNYQIALEDISIGLAFDIITTNDRTTLDVQTPAPIVNITGYCRKPYNIAVREQNTCTRHINACKGRHLGARLIFDLSYISVKSAKKGKTPRVWEQSYNDLWTNDGLRLVQPCTACPVYEEAVLNDEIVTAAVGAVQPRMDSPGSSCVSSSD